MTGLSEQQLAEIEAREAVATPGPWCTDGWEIYQGAEYVAGATWVGETCDASNVDKAVADAEFIAAARTDVPALVAEVERLRSEREAFADRVDTLTAVAKGNKRHVATLFAELEKANAGLDDLRIRAIDKNDQLRTRITELETERHTTNEALDSSMQAIRAAHAAAVAEAADEFEKRTAPTGERLVGKAAALTGGAK